MSMKRNKESVIFEFTIVAMKSPIIRLLVM